MAKINGKESVGEPLILLMFYSMVFVSEMSTTAQIVDEFQAVKNTSLVFDIDNILLIIIPVLLYYIYKSHSILLRMAYLMACIPLIPYKLIAYTGIKANMHLINGFIAFVVVVCLIRYINETFEEYKAAVFKKDSSVDLFK